jgi:DNA-binding CsgD family transcriptional regulator
MADDARDVGENNCTTADFGDLESYVAGVSNSSVLGLVILDPQLRYASVNQVLGAMNGMPPEAHVGKTVQEVIGPLATTVEPLVRSVLVTGQSVVNAEIRGDLPTRDEEGYWLANYFPVHDRAGEVKHVGGLIVEITRLRKIEKYIRTLLGNFPRRGGPGEYLDMFPKIEQESVELWSGSIEMFGICMQRVLKDVHCFQPYVEFPSRRGTIQESGDLPYGPPPAPNRLADQEKGWVPIGTNGLKPLTPKELEIVRMLAVGYGNKEISTALNIAVKTAETHRKNIMLKLQVHSLPELVLFAVRCGLVTP